MEKEKLKENVKKATKCYTNLKPDQKKLIHYTAISFGVGLIFGWIIGKKGSYNA